MSEDHHNAGVGDIFRVYGNDYRSIRNVPASHLKVMQALGACRTAVLGGHLYHCDCCNYEHVAYNSCCNRHCPQCQNLKKAKWLEARKNEVLPATYFHNVFTLPHELNPWIRYNKRLLYDILFQSVADTLLEFGANAKNGLDGQLGFIAALHTWDQRMMEHNHLHCLIPGGALSSDKQRWISANPEFLFPVKALSPVFKAKFIDSLEQTFDNGLLICPEGRDFYQLLSRLRKIAWVVYSKPSFAGPEKVLDYLGRYVNRVAISNERIKKIADGKVTFSYKDRKHQNSKKELTIPATEFIRRFLTHVLPDNFRKIRYYGFLSNRYKKENIVKIKTILDQFDNNALAAAIHKTPTELMFELTGKDITKCPKCRNGKMVMIRVIHPEQDIRPPDIINSPPVIDSS
ncbi:MAG: IS91 family transposase [Victivallales bacterium]|nr:IS91 family transposase [Victivallales bacterium]